MTIPSLLLVGCGKMGGALLRGWVRAGCCDHIDIIEPSQPDLSDMKDITWHDSAAVYLTTKPSAPSVLILAVKPQMMDAACAPFKNFIDAGTLIVSIAAGQTIASFEKRFADRQAIIRTMPNTPAAVGKGMTVAVAGKNVTNVQKGMTDILLGVTGEVAWVEREDWLDAVTAVSGSGPAYVFLLIETLARAGEAAGLPADLAMRLARRTVIGAAALAESEQGTDAATLRQNVTSPGGTTEAALKVLMDENGLQKLMTEAVEAAARRGRDLQS